MGKHMKTNLHCAKFINILLGSKVENIKHVCREVALELAADLTITESLEDFLLAIQENDYMAALIDLEINNIESLKIVRLIHRVRPKVSLIVLTSALNNVTGGKLYTEGVNTILDSPPNKKMLKTTLIAISKTVAKNKYI